MNEPADALPRPRDDFERQVGRNLAHLTSEVGLYRRDIDDVEKRCISAVDAMRQECKDDVQGSVSTPGLLVRIDRLEQARARDIATLRWITGGSMTAALVALAAAAKAAGIY